MKHRRKFRPKALAPVLATVFVVLSATGAFVFQSYLKNGEPNRAADAVADGRIPESDQLTQPSLGPSALSVSASPSVSAPVSPSPSASSAKPSSSATTKAASSGGGSCALPRYPTAACTGVPAGWKPKKTVNGSLTITKAGTVVKDQLVTGSILVKAADVTISNSRVYGSIDNFHGNVVYGHLTIKDTEVVNPPGQQYSENDQYAFGVADYTCLRCKVINRMEGWRVGASDYSGAGNVLIQDSFAQLAVPPGMCASDDPHGDGIQAYGGPKVTIRHNTIDQRLDDCPTAPIFIPDQGNAGATVQDNLLAGGGYALRLTGGDFPSVTGNKIVQGSFGYGPVELSCGLIDNFSGNATVTYDWSSGKVTGQVKTINEC
ncbi:hypothetical protein [Actinoplanes subglobosus]|uniref:Right handed beta helix domain-containing protein n=1 Tax=Actinoplanes subglobosus TaxID=1547892 RepID=A0ABV8J4Z0_9ACTN